MEMIDLFLTSPAYQGFLKGKQVALDDSETTLAKMVSVIWKPMGRFQDPTRQDLQHVSHVK